MYARLAVTTANGAYEFIRDIIRLVTASSPSLSTLSGSGFSNTASVILDATPAGWTYVGSTVDGATLGSGTLSYASGFAKWAISAPCASDASKLKYACFTRANSSSTTSTATSNQPFGLFGATAATSAGVLTNPGGHPETSNVTTGSGLYASVGSTVHLIATPRHITIIVEGLGMHAVWETTTTDATTFYGQAPFIQYEHCPSSSTTASAVVGASTGATSAFVFADAFNVTDVNTSTNYGAVDITGAGARNLQNLAQTTSGARAMSIDASNNPKYQISPVWYHLHWLGHPAQYVTGVVPIYWCKANLGSTGDSVLIGTDEYTYFNCGSTTYGVLMKTS